VSYNRPNLSVCASWNKDAITFANKSLVGQKPVGLFINDQDVVYVTNRENGQILIWNNESSTPTTIISTNSTNIWSLFVTTDGYIYFDNGHVNKWTFNATQIVCNPICDSDQLCSSSNDCTCPSGSTTSPCAPQSTGLCSLQNTLNAESIVSITFGAGASQYSSATPADFQFSTTYTQAFSDTLSYGSFAFANAVPAYHAGWQGNASDHTPNDDTGSSHGYMMIIDAKVNADEIFRFTADSLCIGLTYQFSFYVANLIKSPNNYIKPSIKFEVRTLTAANTLLATLDSGDIAEFNTLTWQRYGLLFVATTSSVVLLAISNTPGGSGNDLAIDDISLIVC
ncbi:unnamed protein product, partial [Rotaria sp. Silwood1]